MTGPGYALYRDLAPCVPLPILQQSVLLSTEKYHRAGQSVHNPIDHKKSRAVYLMPMLPGSLNNHEEHLGHHGESRGAYAQLHLPQHYDTRRDNHSPGHLPLFHERSSITFLLKDFQLITLFMSFYHISLAVIRGTGHVTYRATIA